MVKSLRVLILEDNPADAELVQFELEEAGLSFTSKMVMTEEDFVREIQEYCPDLILSDYDLPKYNGALALAEANKRCPDTPFILVTGAVSEERAIEILTQGAKDYVLKNRLRQRLVPAVRRALAEAEEHRARKKAEAELLDAYRTLERLVIERNAALQKTEGLYHSLFDNMLEGFAYCRMIFDQGQPQDFVYLDVNRSFETLTGLKNVAGKRVSEVIPGLRESDSELFEIYGRVALTGKPERFERYVRALHMWFSVSVYSPEKEYFVATFDVITGRKKAEEDLRRQRELLHVTLASIGDAVIATDTIAQITFMNGVAEALTGWSLPEASGRPVTEVFNIINENTRQAVDSPVTRVLNEGTVVGLANHTLLVSRDGTEIPIDDSGAPIKGADGRTLGVILVFRDITERKGIEKVQTFLAQAGTGPTDEPFFNALARYLAENLSIDFICIDRLEGEGLTARTVAVWCDGHFENNVTYALKDTPCGVVVGKTVCCFPASVCQFFPRDQVLKDLRAESYVGVTLFGHTGQPIGLIAAIGRRPLANRTLAEAILKLVAGRAAGEMERLDAEDALRKSEEKYRIVSDFTHGWEYWLSADGQFRYISPSVENVTGYSVSDFNADPDLLLTLIHPDDHDRMVDHLLMPRSSEMDQQTLEFRIVTKNGEERWLSHACVPVHLKDGTYAGRRASNRNITERKRVEELLRRNQEAAESLANEMTIIAEIGRVVGSNLNIHEVYRRMVAEIGKLIPFDSLTVNRANLQREELEVAYVAGLDIPDRRVGDSFPLRGTIGEEAVRTKKGVIRQSEDPEDLVSAFPGLVVSVQAGMLSVMTVPLIYRDEVIGNLIIRSKKPHAYSKENLQLAEKIGIQIAGAIANAQLFNDLSKMEKSLRESNELFSLFMSYSPIYAFIKEVTPAQSRVLMATDNFRDMIGIPGSEMVGKTMAELFSPEFAAKITTDDWTVVSRGAALRLNEELNGRSYTTIKFPIVRGDKTLLAGYTIDITEGKQAEEEKAKLQAQLLQSQKMESVGRLAGGVAHDFNNMLGVILGHTEMAMDMVDQTQPLYSDLQAIRKAAGRSADLTRQLLAFARKQTVSPRVLNLNETVEGMLNMLRRLIGEDIHLAWLPGANIWSVKIDPSQIDQILANLFVNSRDAIAGVGKITIETGNITFDQVYCADHTGFIPGDYVMIAVSDNGCGMGKEILDKLFEPFFTTKAVGKGTGLGLATVYGIVKQNIGFINVYSELGHGTTVKVYLPKHEGKAEQARKEGPQESLMRGQETILVVEDEPEILNLTKRMLEKQGYQVLAASTPGEAIRLAGEYAGEIHLLMTDVVMPEMNGRDLAKKMFSFYTDIKRLFMSGYTANVIAHHGVLDEGVHFIQKPFSMKDLATKVREALD